VATTVVLTDVIKDPGGAVQVVFADGSGYSFPTLEDTLAWSTEVDQDVTLTQRMCVAYAAARSPDLSNIAPVQGKDFIFDLASPQPIKVQ
jgi:hypothetical protein